MHEPSPYCYVVLILWIPVIALVFALARPAATVIWTSLAGWMFLPELIAFNVPAVQGFDKHILTPAVLFACFAVARPSVFARCPLVSPLLACAVGMTLGDWGTYLTNRDPLVFGSMALPGVDVLSVGAYPIGDAMRILIPFLLGYAAIVESRDLRLLVSSIAMGGVVYSLFMLVEMRLSPQFHNWVYGFNPHDFAQSIRGGGYRPQVFMSHGLTVAMFAMSSTLAAVGLARARLSPLRVNRWLLVAYLTAILVMDRSLAALLYGAALGPLLVGLRPRRQAQVAGLIVALGCAYPIARLARWVPTDAFIELCGDPADPRCQSLAFRFENEDKLLVRASERPWFGWGDWGRNRVWGRDGRDASITDGLWIIMIGCRGFVGWAFRMGLLAVPVWVAVRRIRSIPNRDDQVLIATLASILAAYVVDTIPNSIATTCVWTYAGGLLRVSYALSRSTVRSEEAPQAMPHVSAPEGQGIASGAS